MLDQVESSGGDVKEELNTLCRGRKAHEVEFLKGRHNNAGGELPLEIVEVLRKIERIEWSTDWRYEVGIVPHGEAREFADLANQFLGWVKERLDEHTT